MGRDAVIGTWNVDTDMGKKDKDRTIGDDNSGTTIPLGAFPKKIQEMAKVLVEYENYNQDYLLVSMLSAVATAIGNTCQIRIKGCWTSSPILYVILVGRPGVGKTPPLDFAFKPIRAHDYKLLKNTRKMTKPIPCLWKREKQKVHLFAIGDSGDTDTAKNCDFGLHPRGIDASAQCEPKGHCGIRG